MDEMDEMPVTTIDLKRGRLGESLKDFTIWFLTLFLLGMVAGGISMYQFNKWQMNQAVQLGGFVSDGKIYNVNLRP